MLKLYREDMKIDQSSYDYLAKIELLLAQPAVRSHLTSYDLKQLDRAICKIQSKKYSENGAVYEQRNYLYIGAYDENGWDEKKLNEYAEIYEQFLEQADQ